MYSASKHAVKGFADTLRIEIEEVDEALVSITLILPTAVDTPYPQHAKNYMDREPKLPSPLIDSEKVAEAILKAATHGGRDVKVGAIAVVNTTIAKLIPGLGDKLAVQRIDRKEKHAAKSPGRYIVRTWKNRIDLRPRAASGIFMTMNYFHEGIRFF